MASGPLSWNSIFVQYSWRVANLLYFRQNVEYELRLKIESYLAPTKCICSNVDGDAQMVPREPDGFDAMRILLLQESDVQETDVCEGHWVPRSTIVKNQTVFCPALTLLPEGHNLLDLFLG